MLDTYFDLILQFITFTLATGVLLVALWLFVFTFLYFYISTAIAKYRYDLRKKDKAQ